MKKIFLCVLSVIFCNFIILSQAQAMSQKELQKGNAIINKALESKDVDSYNAATEYIIKTQNKDKLTVPAEILDIATQMNLDRYNTIQEKKYKNNALRYANLAMRNNTQNIQTIITGMSLSYENLDTNSMVRFYDYLCKINPKAGSALKKVFAESVTNVKQIRANNSATTWAVLGGLLYTRLQNRPSYSTTTGTIDANGYVNINTMSY